MVCLSSGIIPFDPAGSLDAPISLRGSTCINCAGCSEEQETEMLSSGRSWCGVEWMQILREQRRRGRGTRERTRRDSPGPWWGSESEQGIEPASEWKDTETKSSLEPQDMSGLRSCYQTALSRMKRLPWRQVRKNSCWMLRKISQKTQIPSNLPHGGWVRPERTVPKTLSDTFTASSTKSCLEFEITHTGRKWDGVVN